MQASDETILNLMERSFFSVPSYQREYSWKKDQWVKLWEDIQFQISNENAGLSHYLGSLVVKEKKSATKNIEVYEVIDGQQRLTTYTIFIAACLSNLIKYQGENEESTSLKKLFSTLISNEREHLRNYSDADKEKFSKKIELLYADREAYDTIMLFPDRNSSKIKGEKNLLLQAYAFFDFTIERYLGETITERKSDEALKKMDNLYVTCSEKINVVRITLSQDDNVQRIFETLNNRGKPLEEKDLIKNLLMMSYPGEIEHASSVYTKYWRDFETETFWKEQNTLNHFLYVFVCQRFPNNKIIHATKLSHRYEEIIKKHLLTPGFDPTSQNVEEQYDNFLGELHTAARWYKKMSAPKLATPEEEFIEIATKSHTSMWAAGLWLFENESLFSPAELAKIRKLLETWVVLREIAKLPNTKQGVEVNIINIFAKYKNGPREEKLSDILSNWMKTTDTASTRMPIKEELETNIVSSIEPNFAKMLLETIEDADNFANLKTPHSTRGKRVDRTMSVEHIMPQKWEDHWPLPQPFSQEQVQKRKIKITTIGNLALLDSNTNSSIKNSDWRKKRRTLISYKLSTETATVAHDYEEWNETTIDERSMNLLKKILSIWNIRE